MLLPILAMVALAAGCGGAAAPSNDVTGGAGGSPATGGATGTGGAANGAGGAAASGNAIVGETPATTVSAPGRYVTTPSTPGAGPCANVALSDVLDEIRAADPTLAGVTTVYNPADATSDGSFIYPYQLIDGGFDIVFKIGSGDCLAGCTDNLYSYFSTDASCKPMDVGHYHATWGTGTCLTVDGVAMWNHPPPPDPATVCGQDNTARDLRGSYVLHASGQRTPCSTSGVTPTAVDANVTLLVEQDATSLATGFVTFTGTGYGLVDGARLPARFERKRFDAASQASNLPSACPRTQSVTSSFDFEGYQPGSIEVMETGNDGCAACKGGMSVTLTATTLTSTP